MKLILRLSQPTFWRKWSSLVTSQLVINHPPLAGGCCEPPHRNDLKIKGITFSFCFSYGTCHAVPGNNADLWCFMSLDRLNMLLLFLMRPERWSNNSLTVGAALTSSLILSYNLPTMPFPGEECDRCYSFLNSFEPIEAVHMTSQGQGLHLHWKDLSIYWLLLHSCANMVTMSVTILWVGTFK